MSEERVARENEAVYQYVRDLLAPRRFTGQLVLHCHQGHIRKTEERKTTRTEDLDRGGARASE